MQPAISHLRIIQCLAAFSMTLWMMGCSAGSSLKSATLPPDAIATQKPPTDLTYSTNPAVYNRGTVVPINLPTSLGGNVVSYAISPALPAGLHLDIITGIISGTPTDVSPATAYTLTAANAFGETTTSVSITIKDLQPTACAYATPSAIYVKGSAIVDNAITCSGGAVVSYSVSGALPAGLTLDSTTGTIHGIPTVVSATTNLTITATNSGGISTASLSLTVNDVAPASLTYGANPAVYSKGTSITSNSPASSGGAVVSYSVSPALPAGLSLDTSTGVISGTPTAITAIANYTVTATNSGGSTTASLSLTVNDAAPSTLTYTPNPAVYTKGTLIANNSPSNSGGGVVSYSVSPALPAGLSLDTATGVISGTPTVLAPVTTYTITATNLSGSTTASLSLRVNDVAPSALTYSSNPAIYTRANLITNNSPSSSGGAVVSYSVSPTLPVGLTLNTSTGVIGGTATVIAASASYTVTAMNSGGSTTASLNLTVNDVAPSGCTYSTAAPIYTKGTATLANNVSCSGGGAPTGFAISPALTSNTGLSFNTSSGSIAGTPSTLSLATAYTVTVSNSGGSTTAPINVTIVDVAPFALTYSTNPAVYTRGSTITGNTPAGFGGVITLYSVSPALPAGMILDSATGVISGTPTSIVATAIYTVTATNSGGSTTADVSISVNDLAPSALTYSTNPATYSKGILITNNTPSSSGGTVVSYSVSPALPTGLSLDTSTGVISGTSTAVAAIANYTVTATNSGGSTTASLSLTVNDIAPAFSYAGSPLTFTRNTTITTLNPVNTGGAITGCSSSPALPTGLLLSTACILSGTPSAFAVSASYTFTATNSGGSSTASITFQVNDLAPAFSYVGGPFTYARTTTIATLSPTNTGGAITGCSSNPALPAGLTLSTACVLAGTPTVISGNTTYTFTATNSGGTGSASITIKVNDVSPLAISPGSNVLPTNVPFTFTIFGGVAPYTFTVLPGGVGSISSSGVYTSSSTGSGTVRVTDFEGHTADASVSLYTPGQITMCTGTQTVTASGGTFYDSGGPSGNYQNNENCAILIQPTSNPGAPLTLTFSSFSLSTDHDFVKVYDGTNASGTPLHTGNGFTGSSAPAPMIATSGALYIVMTTDASIVASGFQASWAQSSAGTPIASFTASSNNVAVNQSISFTDTSTNSPTSWVWDFNSDGINISNSQNPTFAYTTPGKKTVTLTASNAVGSTSVTKVIYVGMLKMCSDTTTNTSTGVLFDSGGPNSNYGLNENCAILVQPPGGPSPGLITLHFNSFSTETSAHYVEVYDGTNTSGVPLHPPGGFTGQNIPSDIFAISGSLYIVMQTPTGRYQGDTKTHSGFEAVWSSTAPGSPGAQFTMSSSVVAVDQPISFTDGSSNSPTSWQWSFQNNGITDSTVQNPTHSFSSPGVYTIQLRVSNASGTSTRTQTVFVGSYDKMCAAGNNTSSTSTSVSGVLYDSGGPSANYSDQETCGFVIQPTGGASQITLSFSTFDLEDTYDFLQVFDGTNSSGVPLHVNSGYSFGFTGQNTPPSVTATSGAMYILFTSDQLVNRTGFSANWTSSP